MAGPFFSWLPQLTFRLAPGAVMVECGYVARAQNTSRWHWTICLKLKFNESIFWQLHKYFQKMLPHALHTNCLTILSCLVLDFMWCTRKICNTKLPKWVRVKGTLCPFCSNWIPGSSCWLGTGVTQFPRHITCFFHCTSKHSLQHKAVQQQGGFPLFLPV